MIELKRDQDRRWDDQHEANNEQSEATKGVHKRLDTFLEQKHVTLAECESRCRGRIADRQWFIYTAIVVISWAANYIGLHWKNIIAAFVRG
jgi:hypothetical protein